MDLRTLGRTGVQVSSLCFGTMSFGSAADETESGRMFRRCLDAGINFFDTADAYGRGRSESILGKLMHEHRDELVIASKVFGRMSDDPNDRGLSKRHLVQAVEGSLQRLGTDRIDVYYLHHVDPLTPIDETMRALDQLVRRGLVLYPAVSNRAAWQIEKALGISAREQLARFEVVQPMYNLAKRQVEVEILPMARAESLAVVPYSPLGGGLLSGKYGTGRTPEHGRLLDDDSYAVRYGGERYLRVADAVTAKAEALGVHPATLAVAWVRSHPDVTAPIVGARDVEQLEPSLAAAGLDLDPEQRAEISALSPAPPPATDRTDDRAGGRG